MCSLRSRRPRVPRSRCHSIEMANWKLKQAESWWGTTVPATTTGAGGGVARGVQMRFTAAGRIFGFRMYLAAADSNDHWFLLGELISGGQFLRVAKALYYNTAGGAKWAQVWIHPTFRITVGRDYYLYVISEGGNFYRTTAQLGSPVTHGHVTFVHGLTISLQDPFSGAPTTSAVAEGCDVLFQAD